MLLIVTKSTVLFARVKKMLDKHGIVCIGETVDSIKQTLSVIRPSAVMIDSELTNENIINSLSAITAVIICENSNGISPIYKNADHITLPISDKLFSDRVLRYCKTDLEYRFLKIGKGPHHVSLLDYKLKLTKTEYTIIRSLAVCGEIKTDLLCRFMNSMSRNCLSVHISSLNKKAALISGRRLVEYRQNDSYSLNELM